MSFLTELQQLQQTSFDNIYESYKRKIREQIRLNPSASKFGIPILEGSSMASYLKDRFLEEGLTVDVGEKYYDNPRMWITLPILPKPNEKLNNVDWSTLPNILLPKKPSEPYTWSHPDVQKCMDYFNQVFPVQSLGYYVLKYLASIMVETKEKLMVVFVGDGNNSKSTFILLIRKTFGNDCALMSHSGVFTHLDAKVCIIQEFCESNDVCPAIIKRLLGGDTFYCRQGEVKCNFKLISVTNDSHVFDGCDVTLKKRIKMIPCLSTFSTARHETPFLYKADVNFNVNPLVDPFKWILEQYLPIYQKEGLVEPDILKAYQL